MPCHPISHLESIIRCSSLILSPRVWMRGRVSIILLTVPTTRLPLPTSLTMKSQAADRVHTIPYPPAALYSWRGLLARMKDVNVVAVIDLSSVSCRESGCSSVTLSRMDTNWPMKQPHDHEGANQHVSSPNSSRRAVASIRQLGRSEVLPVTRAWLIGSTRWGRLAALSTSAFDSSPMDGHIQNNDPGRQEPREQASTTKVATCRLLQHSNDDPIGSLPGIQCNANAAATCCCRMKSQRAGCPIAQSPAPGFAALTETGPGASMAKCQKAAQPEPASQPRS